MKNCTLFLFIIVFLTFNQVSSQEQEELKLTSKDSIVQSSWVVGLGFNAVVDSGEQLKQPFAIGDNWNMVPFPSRLNIGRYFSSGIGLEVIASYNKYKAGKQVDKVILLNDIDYYAVDSRVTYALNKLWGGSKWFDPYVGGGVGYTKASNQGRGTMNGIVGFKTWFSDRFGLDFNSTGKWSMNTDKATNHLQYAVSGLYRFNIKKGLTKKGLVKLALIEEQERVQDSLAAIDLAKEAAALTERLAEEKENARLAAVESAKQMAEEAQKRKIDELSNLSKVHYAFNSSYLTSSDKGKLDELVDFMNKYPETIIVVKGHTDSRGKSKYNDWLSERRAQNVVKYIVSAGMSTERILAKGFGESQITNRCIDGVQCSGAEHKVNRRIEYTLD
ncbi:MAG: OmpA family protein [Flavobacteriaceae bacterium]